MSKETKKERSEDEEYMSDAKAALLSKPTKFASSILYLIVLLLVISLIWAYFSKIDQITIGEGKVIPFSEVKIIQSLDGGTLSEILVDEGNFVKKNQILAKLDDTRYTADYSTAREKFLALSATVARLSAEAQEIDHIEFPADVSKEKPDLVTRETKLFQTRRDSLKTELINLQNVYESAEKEVQMYPPLLEKGYVSKVQYMRSQQTAYSAKQKLLERQNQFRESVLAELTQRKGELASLTEQIISLRDKMLHTVLRSPVDGIIKKINIATVGGVINPGMDIMEIVPLSDSLIVQVHVKPIDIAFVHLGQAAIVKITAYDFSIYGSLEGKVEYISPDVIEDTKQNLAPGQSAPSYYLVNVRTDKSYFGNDKHKMPIIPGMSATVYIKTGKKTVLDYLLKPLLKAKEEALRER